MAVESKEEFPPLLPAGFHEFDVASLRRLCVERFPASLSRARIMDGLEDMLSLLQQNQMRGEVWVNGSFTTEKLNPADADLLFVVNIADARAFDTSQQTFWAWFASSKLRAQYGCDNYAMVRDSDHPSNDWLLAYWLRQFGFSRGDENDTNRMVADLTDSGDEFSQLNLHSISKRRAELIAAIDDHLAASQTSLVQYRIQRSSSDTYPAKAVGEALEKFQDLLTSVYDALVNGPKKRFRPSPESIEKTTLNFAGATAGSVRIVLATEDDRLLIGDTKFERALVLVEKTLSAQTTDDLSALSSEVGIASISKAYDWALSAANYGVKTEIAWGKSLLPGRVFSIAPEEAARVSALIAVKSDEISTDHQMLGVLHGFDKQTSYFHLETLDDHEHVKGEVSEEIPQMLTTGAVYLAVVAKTVSVVYATGEEKEKWTLRRLTPVEQVGETLE